MIAPYAFLTAAHCIIQDQPTPHTLTPADLVVVTGRTDLSLTGGQHLAVREDGHASRLRHARPARG